MKDQHFRKYCNLVKDNAIQNLLAKAKNLPQPSSVKPNNKRTPFEHYSYQQTDNSKDYQELLNTLLKESKQEIIFKMNQYLIDEEIQDLKMQSFMLDHSIAIQRNHIQQLQLSLSQKERAHKQDSFQREEKCFRRVRLSPRKQREPYSSRSARDKAHSKTMKIYSSQNIWIQPQKSFKEQQQSQKRQLQPLKAQQQKREKEEQITVIDKTRKLPSGNMSKRGREQKQLQIIKKIEGQIFVCQKQMRQKKRGSKRQCLQHINSIWSQIQLIS